MKLSATIKMLEKNTLTKLTTYDVITHEINIQKRNAKREKFITALTTTGHLKELILIEYSKPTLYQPIAPLAELLIALANNTSIELLDVSHNHLDEATVNALTYIVQQQKAPLKQLYLDYLNHSTQINLKAILNGLEKHPTLHTLSLRNNELSPETCQSLLRIMASTENQIGKIHLAYCCIASTDIEKLQQAASARGKKFILSIDHIDSTTPNLQNVMMPNYTSLMLTNTLNLPKTPLRLSKSDGDATSTHHYNPLFITYAASSEKSGSKFSMLKRHSEHDIQDYNEKASKSTFNC